MTKLRPPITPEHALDRVVGVIGWQKAVEIAGQAERTIRNWSDPDTKPAAGDAISFDVALRLDSAYQVAGGQGAPFLHCFAASLELANLAACKDRADLACAAAAVAKESGEAVRAAVIASLPGSTPADLQAAERELEESIAAHHDVLTAVRAVRLPEETTRAPEVAPSVANGRKT